MRRALEGLRRRFDENDRTTGEIIVSGIRIAMGVSMIAVLAGGAPMRYYPAAAWSILGAAIAYSWVALAWTAREARQGQVSAITGYLFSALDAGFIIALTGLTGLWTSPMVPILVVVIITHGIRFSLRPALGFAVVTSAALTAVMLVVPQPAFDQEERLRQALWWSWMLLSGATAAGVLSYAADEAHRRRAKAVAEVEAQHHRHEEERALRLRLEAIDEARRDFLHALSHDFRTPIASLEALSQALSWDHHPLTGKDRDEVIRLIHSHARQLGNMLQEVREVAITESLGAIRVEVADVYMPDLIRAAASAAGFEPDRVTVTIGRHLKVLHTDARKLARILSNLLDNARKHSPPDQGVEVRLAVRQDMVELAVLDRGPGIPPELTPQALQKFVSFGEHRSSGLGMWIVSEFTAALGGELVVNPRPGGGLIVRARFPLAIAAIRRHPTEAPVPATDDSEPVLRV